MATDKLALIFAKTVAVEKRPPFSFAVENRAFILTTLSRPIFCRQRADPVFRRHFIQLIPFRDIQLCIEQLQFFNTDIGFGLVGGVNPVQYQGVLSFW